MFAWITHEVALQAFALWLFFAAAFLPRMITNVTVLSVSTLAVGAALAWVLETVSHDAPWMLSVHYILVIVATLIGWLHSEFRFRRAHGYWRILGRDKAL